MNAAVPGWQPDPTGRHDYRYWDGTRWTDDVSDAGATSVDPVGGAPQPTAVQPTVPPGYGEPPPAYVDGYPGGPSHMSASSGGSGPSTGLLVVLGILVAALVGGILFVLLNQDDDGNDAASDDTTTSTSTTQPTTTTTTEAEVTSEQVVDEFATAIFNGSNGEFTEDQAHCMAEGILDVIGLERLAQVRIEAGDDASQNPVDLLTEEEQEAAFDVMRECVPDATIDEIPT